MIRAALFLCLALELGIPAEAQRSRAAGGLVDRSRFVACFTEARHPSDLRRRLHSLKPDAIPFLFRALDEGRLPGPDGRALASEELAAVHETLLALPRRELVRFLDEIAVSDSALRTRCVAATLLGDVGAGEHLKLLARLVTPLVTAPPSFEPRRSFEDALVSILERDPGALRLVRSFFLESPPALSGSIIEALGRASSAEGSKILASLLGHTSGLDPLILARIAARGPCGKREIDEEVRAAARRYLRRPEAPLIAAAVHACLELEDDDSVETLIELVDHPDGLVRGNVFRALQRISGLAFGEDAERWTRWYAGEMSWWERESAEVLRVIELGSGVEFTRAAKEALGHRLFGDRVAEAFVRGLERQDEEHAVLCCQALGQLQSSVGLEALIGCLEHDEHAVREAAWLALRSITGRDLGPEAEPWLAAR
jgi:hypothetical protein